MRSEPQQGTTRTGGTLDMGCCCGVDRVSPLPDNPTDAPRAAEAVPSPLEEPSPLLYQQPPQTIMVGILGIDRDAPHVDAVHAGIAAGLADRCDWRLLVIAREQDRTIRELWRAKGATVVIVPNYAINGRHNMVAIADERNAVCKIALLAGVDGVFFVDGDVIVGPDAVADLLECSRYADVSVVPYILPNASGGVADGICFVWRVSPGWRAVDVREAMACERYPRIDSAPIGCALLRRGALDARFFPMAFDSVTLGEDFGFFFALKAFRPELVVRTVGWPHGARHLFEGAPLDAWPNAAPGELKDSK